MFKAMKEALMAMIGSPSMESCYLALIWMIDQMETLATWEMLPNQWIKPEVVKAIGNLKADIIANFAEEGREVQEQIINAANAASAEEAETTEE